jgi:hypothetical protein
MSKGGASVARLRCITSRSALAFSFSFVLNRLVLNLSGANIVAHHQTSMLRFCASTFVPRRVPAITRTSVDEISRHSAAGSQLALFKPSAVTLAPAKRKASPAKTSQKRKAPAAKMTHKRKARRTKPLGPEDFPDWDQPFLDWRRSDFDEFLKDDSKLMTRKNGLNQSEIDRLRSMSPEEIEQLAKDSEVIFYRLCAETAAKKWKDGT